MSSAVAQSSAAGGNIGNDSPATPVWVWITVGVLTLGIGLYFLMRRKG